MRCSERHKLHLSTKDYVPVPTPLHSPPSSGVGPRVGTEETTAPRVRWPTWAIQEENSHDNDDEGTRIRLMTGVYYYFITAGMVVERKLCVRGEKE